MSSPAELDRKIRQLDNDVQSIYELLSSIQATQRSNPAPCAGRGPLAADR
jgi:hypothetical protein